MQQLRKQELRKQSILSNLLKGLGVRNPVRFSRTPIEYERAPPPLGADTRTELRERLGLDDSTLGELAAAGVIA